MSTATTTSKLNNFPSYTTGGGTVTPDETAVVQSLRHKSSTSLHNGSRSGGGGTMSSRRRSSGNLASGAGGVASSTTATATVLIGSKPSLIAVPPLRFLIMDAPRQSNLHLYIRELRRHSVTDVVRVCEPTYLAGELDSAGMALHEMAYPDGTSPPQEVLDKWLALVDERFVSGAQGGSGSGKSPGGSGGSDGTDASSSQAAAGSSAQHQPTIAVHCVAGLGRAPVLVAIALIEFANLDPVEAVTLIRKHRRGAINGKQLSYLETYKRSYKRADAGGCCVIL